MGETSRLVWQMSRYCFILELTMFYGKMITLCSYACIRAVFLSLS